MLIPALAAFFLSGFAALLYQVTWQRMLVIFSGADVYSATMVIAAFMAGLGCGSLGGGYVADRLSRFAALLAFAIAEAAIAAFGLGSKTLFYDVLYGQFADLAARPLMAAPLLFAVLLVPTSLMGASLPLLARAMTVGVDTAARTVGWLYGINTLGAAAGALSAVWWFIPDRGIDGTLRVAAWFNLACAALLVPLALYFAIRSSWSERMSANATAVIRNDPDRTANPLPFSIWVALYALSGFIALSFELVWFRLLGVMLKSTAFTFGTLLAQYLFWLGAGSAVGSLFAGRVRRPAMVFLMVQASAAVYAGLSLVIIVALASPESSWSWPALRNYFDGYDPLPVPSRLSAALGSRQFSLLYFALPFGLLGPATFLMGLSFPMLQRIVQTDVRWVGRRTGLLLVANIAGSTVGTMLTGLLLLRWLGTATTVLTLVALSGVFAFAALRWSARRKRAKASVAVAVVLLVVIIVLLPSRTTLWAALHGVRASNILVAEDGSGVSVLKSASPSFATGVGVFVNGLGQSHLPYGGIHSELGALPALFHPSPHSAALIGLGSGDTLFAVAGRPELQRIVSIEIVKPQIDTLRELLTRHPYPGLSRVLADPRIQHVFGDGRLVLKVGGEKFDIIEADALRPQSAYAGNLYSREYFELLREQLKAGGFAVTWAPTPRVTRTFVDVFPHVVGFGGILVGSDRIIALDRATIEARLADPRVVNYYSAAGIDIRRLLVPLLNAARVLSARDPALRGDRNSDLDPRDEFGR
jgi:spermidine synthase